MANYLLIAGVLLLILVLKVSKYISAALIMALLMILVSRKIRK